MLRHWPQLVPNMSTDIRGHEALHHHQSLGSFLFISLYIFLSLPASLYLRKRLSSQCVKPKETWGASVQLLSLLLSAFLPTPRITTQSGGHEPPGRFTSFVIANGASKSKQPTRQAEWK